ncbi:MAG: hypothetical protein KF889_18020 [Alphaproteobacteria bacterium]|nr:hypothetical protein [Alphaproteobacteria bacterium]MCW5741350.1 hypothetical protein [Alphaproteobacteria bacterium]
MATPKHAGADSVLDLTAQNFAALSDLAKEAASDAGDSIVELVERGGLFLGNAMLFVNAYHNITVSQYQAAAGKIERTAGTITVSVREYANTRLTNRAGNAPKVRLGLKDILLFQLPGMLKGHLDVDSRDRTLTISKDGKTLLSVGWGEVNASFNGKGSPRMMARTIELLQIWIVLCSEVLGRSTVRAKIGKKDARETHDYAIEDLQTMVDDYLGVDCNGFTGLYLKAKFPKLTVTSQTTEEAYVSREAHNRKTPADIKADDIVAFNDGSYHHVAMVGAVLMHLPGETLVILSEARSSSLVHGGPQSNLWRVRQHVIKDSKGRPTGKTAEGKFDIVGRGKDKFVKIASPDRFK